MTSTTTERPSAADWTTVLLARAIVRSAERDGEPVSARTRAVADLTLPEEELARRSRDSDAQTQPEARSCVTVRSGLLRVPAQIGRRRT
jgi:hypothetical protein